MNLSSHRVFITGGTGGIGLALAKAFAGEGSQVIICGRDQKKLESVLRTYPQMSGFICDVSSPNAYKVILTEMAKNNWKPSILVNNAGVGASVNLVSDDLEYLREQVLSQVNTNFEAPMLLSIALLPLLKNHKEAAIINISSGLALAPTRSSPIYCATKAGLRSFTKSLRYQMERDCPNIKVIEVLPPVVDTDMMKNTRHSKISPESLAAEVIDGINNGRAEIYAGKVKWLKCVSSVFPGLAERVMRGW